MKPSRRPNLSDFDSRSVFVTQFHSLMLKIGLTCNFKVEKCTLSYAVLLQPFKKNALPKKNSKLCYGV